MNWEAIGAIGEISGALAVVLTLLYLARQIQESRKATVAQIYQGRADAASRSIGQYPIGARLAYSLDFSDADEGFEQLSNEEREQLGSYPSVITSKAAIDDRLKTGHKEPSGTRFRFDVISSLLPSVARLLFPSIASCEARISGHGRGGEADRAWR